MKKHSKNRICGASETSLVHNCVTFVLLGAKNNCNYYTIIYNYIITITIITIIGGHMSDWKMF